MNVSGPKRMSSQNLGIFQGSRVLFSDFADGGMMWTGSGPRESRHIIAFDEAFTEAPSVMVSISMWDTDHKSNARGDISAEHITEKGFHIVFRTWGDTRVARIRADWIAIGALDDHENWQLY